MCFLVIYCVHKKWERSQTTRPSLLCVCKLLQVETARLQPQAVPLRFPTVMSLWKAAVTRVHHHSAHCDISMPDLHVNDLLIHIHLVFLFRSCSSSCQCSHQASSTLRIQLPNHASCLPTKPRPQARLFPLTRRLQTTRIPAVLTGTNNGASLWYFSVIQCQKRLCLCFRSLSHLCPSCRQL